MPRNIEENIFPNELMYHYDDTQYVFRWSMISEQNQLYPTNEIKKPIATGFGTPELKKYREQISNSVKFATQNNNGGYIIAESGVTAEYNIRDIEFGSVVADGTKIISTSISMEIFEPLGCTLFDQMHLASLILGVSDWRRSPAHVLELYFKGKKLGDNSIGNFSECVFNGPNTNDSTSVESHWYWTLTLVDIKAKIDEGGTVYSIKGILGQDKGKDKQIMAIPATMGSKKTTPGANAYDIFNNIAEQMNKWYVDQAGEKPIPRHSFEFNWVKTKQYEEYIKDYKTNDNNQTTEFGKEFTITPPSDDSIRSQLSGDIVGGEFKWSEGTAITRMLQDVQISSPLMNMLMHGKSLIPTTGTGGCGTDGQQIESNRVMKFDFRIETEAIPLDYIPSIRDYRYHFIYHIIPFAVSNVVTDATKPNLRNTSNNAGKQHQRTRIEKINKTYQVCKKYRYIYTGDNQEILNFNIDLDFLWFAQMPKSSLAPNSYDAGIRYSSEREKAFNQAVASQIQTASVPGCRINMDSIEMANADKEKLSEALADYQAALAAGKAVEAEKHLQEINKITQEENARLAAENTASSNDLGEINSLLSKIQDEINDGGVVWFEDENNVNSALQRARSELGSVSRNNSNEVRQLAIVNNRAEIINKLLSSIENSKEVSNGLKGELTALRDRLSSDRRTRSNSIRTRKSAAAFNTDAKYIGDLQIKKDADSQAALVALQEMYAASDPIKVTTKVDMEDMYSTSDRNTQTTNPVSQELTMAMLNQMQGGWLMEIELEIRGDPFWIGMDNTHKMERLEKAANGNMTIPDWTSSQNLFMLEFRFPKSYDPTTGEMEYSTENMFKGLYNVTEITHMFKSGKFTQRLKAKREILTVITEDTSGDADKEVESSNNPDGEKKITYDPSPASGTRKGTSSTVTTSNTEIATGAALPDRTTNTSNGVATGKLNSQQMGSFKDSIGARESSNNYQAENTLGYVGKYQFGGAALIDVGEVDSTRYNYYKNQGMSQKEILEKDDVWKKQGGKEAFLNNPSRQETAMDNLTKQNYQTLSRIGVINANSTDEEIGGYLAASHLGGPGNAKKLAEGGSFSDAYGTDIQEYYDIGSKSV